MNKYTGIFKTSFKQEKSTTFDTLLRVVSFVIIVYILLQLWQYIYRSGSGQIINGYTLQQMIWYLIVGECITFSARSSLIAREITGEIQSGSIAYKLNKPYNYYLYCITTFMAKSCFTLLFMIPAGLIVGAIFVGFPPTFTWLQILPCLLVIIGSNFMTWSLYAIVGLIAFWCQESSPFAWIVSKFLMLLGMFFPVEFFPAWLQPIIKFSPIYSIVSGPSSLVANFSWGLFGQVILSQAVWSIIIVALGIGVYNLGKRKVVSNGG